MTANDEGTGSLKDHWGQVICLVLDFPMTASSVKCLLVTFFFFIIVLTLCVTANFLVVENRLR